MQFYFNLFSITQKAKMFIGLMHNNNKRGTKKDIQKAYINKFGMCFPVVGEVSCFSQDPSDFEWSFWTEWARKSLLWTLIGHGFISRLTSIFYPTVGSSLFCQSNVVIWWETFFNLVFFYVSPTA